MGGCGGISLSTAPTRFCSVQRSLAIAAQVSRRARRWYVRTGKWRTARATALSIAKARRLLDWHPAEDWRLGRAGLREPEAVRAPKLGYEPAWHLRGTDRKESASQHQSCDGCFILTGFAIYPLLAERRSFRAPRRSQSHPTVTSTRAACGPLRRSAGPTQKQHRLRAARTARPSSGKTNAKESRAARFWAPLYCCRISVPSSRNVVSSQAYICSSPDGGLVFGLRGASASRWAAAPRPEGPPGAAPAC